jgi:Protein of unknown function (DUF2889)
MLLDLRGHPLHTRSLSITLTRRGDGRLDVSGELVDLRKRGFVPVAGELQPSGIVHHMLLDAVVDPATRVLDDIAARQPAVAFEATAMTRGESCRDPVDRIRALAGTPLDDAFARRLGDEIGGPRGCSHILTLAHLLASTVTWLLERGGETADGSRHRPGERTFRRDVIVDGVEPPGGGVDLALQLIDLELAPAPPAAPSMDRFAAAREVRALAAVDLGRYAFGRTYIVERRRDASHLDAPWRERADVAAGLPGLSIGRGVSAALLALLDGRPDDQPVQDGLLMLAPALIQVFAALSDDWPALAREQRWVLGMGGQPDSCWMWRRGGALEAARTPEDPSTTDR